MAVGAGGWLGTADADSYIAGFPQSIGNNKSQIYRRESLDNGVFPYSASIHFAALDTWGRLRVRYDLPRAWIQGGVAGNGTGWTAELYHTGNISSASVAHAATAESATTALNALGAGQTWLDVTASRAFDTTYINTTGRPIMVNVGTVGVSNITATMVATVGGVSFDVDFTSSPALNRLIGVFIVPSGATYQVRAERGLRPHQWAELR